MKQLFLAELGGYSDDGVREHLSEDWLDYGTPDIAKQDFLESIEKYDIVIACVENYGYEESAFFLLKEKDTGKYFEVHGSHCSCYGFEGQFQPEETSIEYLKSEKFNTSVYLDHKKEILDFIKNL